MNRSLQSTGLLLLAALALVLLLLIGWTFSIIGAHITPQGQIPSTEAFGLTALLLSFREVIATMRSIWETADRTNLTDKLAASQPGAPPAPTDARAAADAVAGAAQDRADEVSGR